MFTKNPMGIYAVVLSLALLLSTSLSLALPLSIDRNQGDIRYQELVGKNLRVYHDARAAHEGALVARAMEAALPFLSSWMEVSRQRPLPVIVSAATDGVSFANFITDAIELQTRGQGTRELYWHELTHMLMYEHFHNIFGPAGSVLHLPWLPGWFIEGLAEALAVSLGSDVQASIERHHALTNSWPSYDQLFVPYEENNLGTTIYGVSGAFVAWMLRQKSLNYLPLLLQDFYRYTFPDYVLWSMVPSNNFMPFDAALENHLGKDGRTLYELYKQAAHDYWQSAKRGTMLSAESKPRLLGKNYFNLQRRNKQAMVMERTASSFVERPLVFDPQSGWAKGVGEAQSLLPPHSGLPYFAWDKNELLSLRRHVDLLSGDHRYELVKGEQTLAWPHGQVEGLWITRDHYLWLEKEQENSRLCVLEKFHTNEVPTPTCTLDLAMPQQLSFLGARYLPAGELAEVWLVASSQHLTHSSYQLVQWLPGNKLKYLPYQQGGTPLGVYFSDSYTWLLRGEHNRRSLLKIDSDGSCFEQRLIEDFPLSALVFPDDTLVVELYQGAQSAYRRVAITDLPVQACVYSGGQTSPLQWAMAQEGGKTSLAAALGGSLLWQKDPRSAVDMAALENKATQSEEVKEKLAPSSQAYQWRSRHIVSFPWLGSDDPLGAQLGLISLPLMDDLQNETLRATLLYGLKSSFPNLEITLQSNRWWPTLSATLLRRQLWNGTWAETKAGPAVPFYYDERGALFSLSLPLQWWRSKLISSVALRSSALSPYLGSTAVPSGGLHQLTASLAYQYTGSIYGLNLGLVGKTTPGWFNRAFDFSSAGVNASLQRSIKIAERSLQGSLRFEYGHTFGVPGKSLLLQEYYTPMRIFIPGTATGFNQASFGLLGRGRLFSALFGDTKGQLAANVQYPLIPAIDRQRWLFYFKELSLLAFTNYGGAWTQGEGERKDHLLAAHGAQTTVFFENKGVHFNLGLGLGRVFGDSLYQLYATFAFDAFF